MKSFRQFLLGVLATLAIFFLFRSFFCQYFCPQEPCPVPNPTIEFNVVGGNFGVTAHPVPGANTVTIDVFGHDGTLATSATPAIGTQQIINVPAAQRPLQLVFAYKSASNTVVAQDSILIDDRENGGTPIMEILMGVHQGNQQSCPNLSNAVTVSTVSPVTKKFTWTPTKQYKIEVAHGSTEVFILKTEFNGVTGCYKAILWQQDEFACLTPSTFTQLSSTEVQVTTGSGNVKITGTDTCNGGSAREVFIKSSTPGATVTVVSD